MRRPMRKLSESSECSAALGIPKVALLFLTPGDMPLEEVRLPPVPHLAAPSTFSKAPIR